MFRELALRIRDWLGRHPSDGSLLSFRDGELSSKRHAALTKHLEKCERCQARARDLEQEWNRLSVLSSISGIKSPIAENELLTAICAQIHAWSHATPSSLSSLPAPDYAKTETGRKLAEALSVYLGPRASAALLQAGGMLASSSRERLAGADLTLSTLLGRKCAAAIDVRLHRIMEEGPKSALETS